MFYILLGLYREIHGKIFLSETIRPRALIFVDKGREDPSPTVCGPSSARQRNAIKWRFAGMPMNAQH